jgi:hypothetical protein
MKKQFVYTLVVFILLALGAGFWVWKNGKNIEQQQTQAQNQIRQQNEQKTSQLQEVDTSSWKTYRSNEYGIEFKYPNNFVVVAQPSASKMFGTVFIITQSTYDNLQKNSPIFRDNPLLGLIDSGEGIEIRWNRSSWIANYFQSNDFEKAFKILLHDGELATYPNGTPNQSSMFKTIVLALSKVTNANVTNEMYEYELQLKNIDTGSSSTRKGLIWEEQNSFYGELQFINQNAPDSDLKGSIIQTALSFKMF